MKHFKTLASYLEYVNFPKSEHPLLSVVSIDEDLIAGLLKSSPAITNDFYSISLKRVVSGALNYGRTQYDFSNGAMVFMSPRQVTQWDEQTEMEQHGFIITFHEDFIRGTELSHTIKNYGYFSYATNEALHVSPKEEQLIQTIFETIESEYHNNQDEFSKDIIISQLETLLKYSDRFYKRQFINRQEASSILLDKFKAELRRFYTENQISGIANIEAIANKLSVSQRYLSDTLKTETGKSAKEHINLFIVAKAKDMLIGTSESISQIAYDLGFEYPQHFSKMFKKQTGQSPKEYRHHLN
ncbi:AraC family transcriptional regulator [Winogradskyella sp.]|jgi:AraC-like DNA-binding protein|uniref:helix-turn-helix domain-containing protein n=1 Tax=Winogradskyella sp. TaxID=1883156 RepID=UPI0025EA91A4|nr:helix-turn-helix domain-containing protein [Winogradskyella sp.]MCT4629039.1 helix-turn-helix domain-containing protein [Winogradskyella sp.]